MLFPTKLNNEQELLLLKNPITVHIFSKPMMYFNYKTRLFLYFSNNKFGFFSSESY